MISAMRIIGDAMWRRLHKLHVHGQNHDLATGTSNGPIIRTTATTLQYVNILFNNILFLQAIALLVG